LIGIKAQVWPAMPVQTKGARHRQALDCLLRGIVLEPGQAPYSMMAMLEMIDESSLVRPSR
jgi:hypothetical protein